MAYSTNQSTLSYRVGNIGAFTQIPQLREIPEFGGTPEKIDVTTLRDRTARFIPGIKDYGDLMFQFLYDNSAGGNYRVLKGLASKNTVATFQLQYPDGTAHEFAAIPSVRMDAGTVNGALTFTASMMLQGDIRTTNGGETGAGPGDSLKSRILTAEDYSFIPNGHRAMIEKTGPPMNSFWEDEYRTHNAFLFRQPQYGGIFQWSRPIISEEHKVATAQFSHDVRNISEGTWEFLGIPTVTTDIQAIRFEVVRLNSLAWSGHMATVNVEPFTAEGGFETFRIYGEFDVDLTDQGGGLNTVAYSIVIGARPNQSGDHAIPLFRECCCPPHSGVRFELTKGGGGFAVEGFVMKAAAATNNLVRTLQHVVEFKEPLQHDCAVNFRADITAVKSFSPCGSHTARITQPIDRTMMIPGQRLRDDSDVYHAEDHFGTTFEGAERGFRVTELFEDKLLIETGLTCYCCGDFTYRTRLGWSEYTHTLDVHHLEVISRA